MSLSKRLAYLSYGDESEESCLFAFDDSASEFRLGGCGPQFADSPRSIKARWVRLVVEGIVSDRDVTVIGTLPSAPPCAGRSPMNGGKFFDRNGIRDRWMVVLDEAKVLRADVPALAASLAAAANGKVLTSWREGPLGFALKAGVAGAAAISTDSRVRFVESDVVFEGKGWLMLDGFAAQGGNTWAIDRSDQQESVSALDDAAYRWPETLKQAAQRPRLFVLDNGIMRSHEAFQSISLPPGVDFAPTCDPAINADHGTAVASAAVGRWGLAQRSVNEVYDVRVLGKNYNGTTCIAGTGTSIASGLDWVLARAVAGDIVNMSLGGSELAGMIEMQVQALIANGVIVVSAAGNEKTLVNYPPANIPGVLTVGATTSSDELWIGQTDGSNTGPLVDIYAPGYSVNAASTSSPTAWTTVPGGTSAAAGFASGSVVQLVTDTTPRASDTYVAEVVERLVAEAQTRVQVGAEWKELLQVRGRPLERSTAQLGSAGYSAQLAGLAGSSYLVGLHAANGGVSLARLPVGPDGNPSSTLVALRQSATGVELCRAVTDEGAPGPVAGCWSPSLGRSEIFAFDSAGNQTAEVSLGLDEVPWAASEAWPIGAVLLTNSAVGGGTWPTWDGRKVTVLRAFDASGLAVPGGPSFSVVAPSGSFLFGNAVTTACDQVGAVCEVFALVTIQHPPTTAWRARSEVQLWRQRWLPGSGPNFDPALLQLVWQRAVDIPASRCVPPGISVGFGAEGVAVAWNGDEAVAAMVVGDTVIENGECHYAGHTRFVRASAVDAESARGLWLDGIGYGFSVRTGIGAGSLTDPVSFTTTPVVVSLDRHFNVRWQATLPGAPDRQFVAAHAPTNSYKGHVVEYSTAGWALRTFDP